MSGQQPEATPRENLKTAAPNDVPHSVSVSVVVYDLNAQLLRRTLASLARSLESAHKARLIGEVVIDVIDNGSNADSLANLLNEKGGIANPAVKVALRSGHGNIGYGRGHNMAIHDARSTFHLVLNPDVILSEAAVTNAIRYMCDNPGTVLLTPEVRGPEGEKQYLCRQYPSLMILYLRSFAPRWLKQRSAKRLAAYELRDRVDENVPVAVPVATGCFMLARTWGLRQIGGFAPAFFLYFEDYDLSVRIGTLGDVVYVPTVRITHFGGDASKKGWKHVVMFVRSGFTFFRSHGWRIW